MSIQQPSVEFANVSYAPPSASLLLKDISLSLEPGTTTAILGRSGSGKTTFLRMVNGLVMPGSGQVLVVGRATTDWPLLELRRSIGYVIQESGLFPHMSAARNAGLALELAGRSPEEIQTRSAEVLSLCGLDPVLSQRLPWQLSGGQRQRVGLARAIALNPGVLLLDEPFGALDPLTRAEMQTMLHNLLLRVRKTALLVTHDLDEALYLAHRIIFLVEGEIAADLPSEAVLTSHHPRVLEYVAAVHRSGRP
ncbi:ATP-binding cassette domain-containing protein [Granulicella sp. WH15]|uniref:ATP-binding cassette domain-containing protein n=1 Tax=Granulicella sp. WH15 TaxID=2602070 RepID=UPI0013672EAC|nr:ATP-binding cassette domain-containing protein [Granulicella sp. WH15]QHN04793.1 ATP-binding cassette domain-containing protein [Granulicella sp. WH15]